MIAPRLGWWWAAVPLLVAGLALFATDHVRPAAYTLAAGLLVGAALRLVLPVSRSGGLAVRSRVVDVVTMAVLGVGIAIVAALLDLRPRG